MGAFLFRRHCQRSATRGNWLILLMKVAVNMVKATENAYTNFMCCDQKFKISNWTYHYC